MEQGEINIRHADAVKNKTGEDDVEGQLRQGIDVQPEFAVHGVTDGDKNEKRKDIIRNDL